MSIYQIRLNNKSHNSKILNVFSIFIHIQYHEGVFLLMLWSCFQKALRFDCLVIHDIRFPCLVPSYSNNIEFD